MVSTVSYYQSFTYGIPFSAFGIIFLLVSIIHRRVNWFLLRAILGVGWSDGSDSKNQKSRISSSDNSNDLVRNKQTTTYTTNTYKNPKELENVQTKSPDNSDEKKTVNTYLYIDLESDYEVDISPLRCIERFVRDIIVSTILAIFVAIIFDSLLLSQQNVLSGTKCPEYDAECFGNNGSGNIGTFNCTGGQNASFPVSSVVVWCAGWVYQTKTIKDILETLGTCGGLLGIISSIVPFVYYLSYYKTYRCLGMWCIILPLAPVVGLILTIAFTLPEGPSTLMIVVLSVVILMAVIGWGWAIYQSCFAGMTVREVLRKLRRCKKRPDNSFSGNEDSGCCSCFWKKYKFYPWCCIYRHCIRRYHNNKSNNIWQKISDEEDQSAQSIRKVNSSSSAATPVSIGQPTILSKQYSPNKDLSRKVAR